MTSSFTAHRQAFPLRPINNRLPYVMDDSTTSCKKFPQESIETMLQRMSWAAADESAFCVNHTSEHCDPACYHHPPGPSAPFRQSSPNQPSVTPPSPNASLTHPDITSVPNTHSSLSPPLSFPSFVPDPDSRVSTRRAESDADARSRLRRC